MKEGLVFNEISWHIIDQLLPNDEKIKLAVLQDFIWFFSRPKKFKNNQHAINDYIRHLELKSNQRINRYSNETNAFKSIDITVIKLRLSEFFIKGY